MRACAPAFVVSWFSGSTAAEDMMPRGFVAVLCGKEDLDAAAMSIGESGGGPAKPWPVMEGARVARQERCSKASATVSTSTCYASRDSGINLILFLAAFDPDVINAILVLQGRPESPQPGLHRSHSNCIASLNHLLFRIF
jgi:hypothetical protein